MNQDVYDTYKEERSTFSHTNIPGPDFIPPASLIALSAQDISDVT